MTLWFLSPYGPFQELGRWLECAERSDSPPAWCWSIDREQVGAMSLSLSLSMSLSLSLSGSGSGSASPSLSLPTSVFRLHWAGCDHAFAVDRSRLISDLRRAVFDHDNPYGELVMSPEAIARSLLRLQGIKEVGTRSGKLTP